MREFHTRKMKKNVKEQTAKAFLVLHYGKSHFFHSVLDCNKRQFIERRGACSNIVVAVQMISFFSLAIPTCVEHIFNTFTKKHSPLEPARFQRKLTPAAESRDAALFCKLILFNWNHNSAHSLFCSGPRV